MVHPCGAERDNPGSDRRTKLHACTPESSKTLCGLDVFGVNVTAGYTSICLTCFPEAVEVGQQDGGNDGRRMVDGELSSRPARQPVEQHDREL